VRGALGFQTGFAMHGCHPVAPPQSGKWEVRTSQKYCGFALDFSVGGIVLPIARTLAQCR